LFVQNKPFLYQSSR